MVRLICTAKTGAAGVITSESEFGALPNRLSIDKTDFYEMKIVLYMRVHI